MALKRWTPLLAAVLAAAACGGDDGTGVTASFPEIAGEYDYAAQVEGAPEAEFVGTLEIFDVSRNDAEFTGNWTIYLVDTTTGDSVAGYTGPISSGTVQKNRSIEFDFGTPDYHHSGTVEGSTITGTWVLQGETTDFTGPFTAQR
ncbi:MAG: hypothetical protein GWN71_25345 [Gammaproteobacteria bacterium]|nr:hypothetical protein [Gemmatimonadota bacterium]NIU76765.1 hypothetical protein [Gammaproteobacteria bacterium]NIY10486.1 hypothetical protein [Gemmatimonadota bacterium]